MTDGRELLIEIIALAFTTPSSRGNEFLALVRVRVDRIRGHGGARVAGTRARVGLRGAGDVQERARSCDFVLLPVRGFSINEERRGASGNFASPRRCSRERLTAIGRVRPRRQPGARPKQLRRGDLQ